MKNMQMPTEIINNQFITKKFLNDYCKLPVPLKATLWFAMCQFFQRGIGILTTPFFTRILPTGEYGRINVFYSWESIFTIIITLSSGKSLMNLCAKYEDKDKLLSSIIGLNIFLSLMMGILIRVFFQPIMEWTSLSKILIICMYLFCFFQCIISCWIGIKEYQYSYRIVVIETLIYSAIASFGGLVVVALISQTAEARIIPQVLSVIFLGVLIIAVAFQKNKTFYDREIWKYALCFSVPLLPHYFSEIILLNSDRIMIDKMCGASDVAIYSIAYSVGSLINIVAATINSSFVPYQYHKIESKEYEILAKNTNYIISFIALCLCGIMMFSREIILIFGGTKYIKSTSLIIPISLGVFYNYVFQMFARVQEYFEQKYTIVIASISCAILNIVLNYIFIPICGFSAAAYTTFFCYFVFCILHYIFYRFACKKHIGQEIYDIKHLIIISMFLIVIAIGICFINHLLYLKYAFIMGMLVWLVLKRKKMIAFIRLLQEKE